MLSDLSMRTQTRQPVWQLNKGPWGMVEYKNPPDTSLWGPLGLAQDMLQTALHAIANQFPKKYQAKVALIVEIVAAAWTAGALSGLLLQTFSALNATIAKKLAGDLVSKVITPDLAMKAVTTPPMPPGADLSTMVKKLMEPINGMAARSAKGDPVDGLGKTLADAARAAATATDAHTAAKAKADLATATAAVGQLQTNLAIMATLAFTNELRANLWATQPIKFYGGWSPDQWFHWVQSLPLRPHEVTKTITPAYSWTMRDRRPIPTPWGNDPLASSPFRVQMAKTARRDALRVYFKAAGIPSSMADRLQAMIEASAAAQDKIKAGDSLVHVIVAAVKDAVTKAAAAHAKAFQLPAAKPQPTPQPVAHTEPAPASTSPGPAPPAAAVHKPGQLAPLMVGATVLAKVIAAGV